MNSIHLFYVSAVATAIRMINRSDTLSVKGYVAINPSFASMVRDEKWQRFFEKSLNPDERIIKDVL